MAPLIVKDADGDNTILHFGVESDRGENLVMIQQVSQAVLLDKECWLALRQAVDESFGVKK